MAGKVLTDTVVRVPLGIWTGMIASILFYTTLATCETLLAGALRRQGLSAGRTLAAYAELLLLVGLPAIWLSPFMGIAAGGVFSYRPDALTGNIGLVLLVLAAIGYIRRWHRWSRGGLYLALFLNLLQGAGFVGSMGHWLAAGIAGLALCVPVVQFHQVMNRDGLGRS
jgi:hypothetical protein